MTRLHSHNIMPTLAALHAGEFQLQRATDVTARPSPKPFVTISRQVGAGGRSLANGLIERLQQVDPADPPWTAWDNELIDRVAREHHLSAARIAVLEDERPNWLQEALGGLSLLAGGADPEELAVFHRVAATIRGLADVGRVVIVGLGSAFVTPDMPGGVHVRLVAPLDFRVAQTARSLGISPEAAADWVRDKDRAREAFYRRHWPNRPIVPEHFTMTLNTAALTIPQQVEAVLAALPVRHGVPAGAAA